jgi:hypothetical protein
VPIDRPKNNGHECSETNNANSFICKTGSENRLKDRLAEWKESGNIFKVIIILEEKTVQNLKKMFSAYVKPHKITRFRIINHLRIMINLFSVILKLFPFLKKSLEKK